MNQTSNSTASVRLRAALDAIDVANSRDSKRIAFEGAEHPAEAVYGWRMSRALTQLYPEASEALRIAARGQHIERWLRPRGDFPEGRDGYLRWRGELKRYHAHRVAEIMAAAGYPAEQATHAESLVRKHRLKRDPEAQALEDVACIVFLEDYLADFAAKHEDSKVIGILRKTWLKMSPHGHQAALRLELSDLARALVSTALAPPDRG